MTETTTKPLRPNASRHLIRPDYHRKPRLTYAEVADYLGVAVHTVENWVATGRLRLASKVGPYRIDQTDLASLMRTGKGVN